MALQRTTEGRTGQHSYSRESARDFEIRTRRADFLAHSPARQAEIRGDVIARLRQELARGQRQPSALARQAGPVYGIKPEDL